MMVLTHSNIQKYYLFLSIANLLGSLFYLFIYWDKPFSSLVLEVLVFIAGFHMLYHFINKGNSIQLKWLKKNNSPRVYFISIKMMRAFSILATIIITVAFFTVVVSAFFRGEHKQFFILFTFSGALLGFFSVILRLNEEIALIGSSQQSI